MKAIITNFTRDNSEDKFYFEHCMVKSCAKELLDFAKENNIIYFVYEWLLQHEELQHGTKAEIIKLYCNDELVAYASIESYEFRNDKTTIRNGISYQDLGLIHFATSLKHRKKGYASLLSDVFYKDVVKPLLDRHDKNSFIIATGRATPLIERAGIDMNRVALDFYSNQSFDKKVLNHRKKAA